MPNKATAHRAMAVAIAGIEPKEFLLKGLAYWHGVVLAELAKGPRADRAILSAALARGREFAKDVAPYCHSRLSAIRHEVVPQYDLTKLNEEQLEQLKVLLTLASPTAPLSPFQDSG